MAKGSDDVDGDTERLLQIGSERNQIKEASPLRHLDEKIKLAAVACLPRPTEPNTRTFRAP